MRSSPMKAFFLIFWFDMPCRSQHVMAQLKGPLLYLWWSLSSKLPCNDNSINNSQGHPGKEGPNGEKGHMASFLPLSDFHLFIPT